MSGTHDELRLAEEAREAARTSVFWTTGCALFAGVISAISLAIGAVALYIHYPWTLVSIPLALVAPLVLAVYRAHRIGLAGRLLASLPFRHVASCGESRWTREHEGEFHQVWRLVFPKTEQDRELRRQHDRERFEQAVNAKSTSASSDDEESLLSQSRAE